MNFRTILSLGLMISFFLPWIDLTFITLSGYNIPLSLDKLATLGDLIKNNGEASFKISYIIYLIPILSSYNVITALSKKENNLFVNEFHIGVLCCVIFYTFISSFGEKVTSILSIGYYLTACISVIGIFEGFVNDLSGTNKKNSKSSNVNKEKSQEISNEEKEGLLKQLEQLHSLKEKEVLTNEIYEQEKNKILIQLQNKEPLGSLKDSKAFSESTSKNLAFDSEKSILKKSKFKKKKVLLIAIGIILLISLIIWSFKLFYDKKDVSENNSNNNIDSTTKSSNSTFESRETEWNIYLPKFTSAFSTKNLDEITPLVSSKFYAGGDNPSGPQWLEGIFSEGEKYENGYPKLYQKIKAALKKPKISNNELTKTISGNGKFPDLVFEYKKDHWELIGYVEGE